MSAWLIDTLVWTAALIALVLVLRRPVARWFGPQAAYALWALPLLRLVLPPLTLPAWMAPPAPAVAPPPPEGELVLLLQEPAAMAADAPLAASSATDLSLVLADLALGLWLAGMAVFLALRFRAYWRMRDHLLADSRDVGRAGRVRLVETPSTSAPLAFGVIDPVVALPKGFLATWDREARDLALAHELVHHRGHDLLINMAVQPLFAMHWFNPLARLGWIALRRDQEAACDARVVADASPAMRATYARVIASFAAGPNVALAAPMACPVLGDKSIIHRLRSLRMNEFSSRRRIAGRGLLAAALIALPLTATITYAEAAQDAPVAPEAPAAPEAPNAPDAPAAPGAPKVIQRHITIIDHPDGADPDDASLHTRVIEQDGKTIVFKSSKELSEAEVRERVAKAQASMAEAEALAADGKAREAERRAFRFVMKDGEQQMSKEERAAMHREIQEAMREMHTEMAEARKEMRLAFSNAKAANGEMVEIDLECDTKGEAKDGKVRLCRSEVMASALEGLKSAREAIAGDKSIPEDARLEVLRSLDQEIENWAKEGK